MIHIPDKKELSDFAEQYKLNTIILFGSALNNSFSEESDIDIAVIGNTKLSLDELFELEMYYEDYYGRTIDVVDLKSESLDFFIKVNILNTGEVLFSNDNYKSLEQIRDDVEWYYRENEAFFSFRRRNVLS